MYTFKEIIGNEKILNSFKKSIQNNKISHAYILDGKEKTGKTLIAKSFAKLLLCENSGLEPCLTCTSCISFDTDNNPDFFFIDTEKKSIGVDDIREKVIKNIETKPFKYKYKVFIIKNAQNMTIQAQNAILKTIEEPPSFAIFIFLTKNYNSFLPTILSRCILFKIKPLSPALIENYLINKGINSNIARFYSAYSRGSIGKALEIAYSENFITFRQDIIQDIERLENLNQHNITEIYNIVNKYENMKDSINEILNIYLLTYRDSLIYKQTNNTKSIIQKDIENHIKKIANNPSKKLINNIDFILKAKLNLEQNSNFNMTIECLLLDIKGDKIWLK